MLETNSTKKKGKYVKVVFSSSGTTQIDPKYFDGTQPLTADVLRDHTCDENSPRFVPEMSLQQMAGTYLLTDAYKTSPPAKIKTSNAMSPSTRRKSKAPTAVQTVLLHLVIGCLPSGNRMLRRGSRGRIIRRTGPGKFEPIPWVYAEIIRSLAKYERVELVVHNAAAGRQVRRILEHADALAENIRFHHWPTNRVWLRDSGCIFLKRRQPDLGWPGTGARNPLENRDSKIPGVTITRLKVSLQCLGEIFQLAI